MDLNATFQRLLGPRGIVNQIALTATTQLITIMAYIISGQQTVQHREKCIW